MGKITRPGVEELRLRDCPCCGGSVEVSDCGYASFNPGTAYCRGECKRQWDLGYVNDQWDSGIQWNKTADIISKKLRAFQLIKVDSKLTITRDFAKEELQEEAKRLLEFLEIEVIGAIPEGSAE